MWQPALGVIAVMFAYLSAAILAAVSGFFGDYVIVATASILPIATAMAYGPDYEFNGIPDLPYIPIILVVIISSLTGLYILLNMHYVQWSYKLLACVGLGFIHTLAIMLFHQLVTIPRQLKAADASFQAILEAKREYELKQQPPP